MQETENKKYIKIMITIHYSRITSLYESILESSFRFHEVQDIVGVAALLLR